MSNYVYGTSVSPEYNPKKTIYFVILLMNLFFLISCGKAHKELPTDEELIQMRKDYFSKIEEACKRYNVKCTVSYSSDVIEADELTGYFFDVYVNIDNYNKMSDQKRYELMKAVYEQPLEHKDYNGTHIFKTPYIVDGKGNRYQFEIDIQGAQRIEYVKGPGEFLIKAKNGKVVDKFDDKESESASRSTSSSSSTSKPKPTKKPTSKPSSNKNVEWPDCDDYDSYEDFMDDWEGNMPGGMDADDYWDNW